MRSGYTNANKRKNSKERSQRRKSEVDNWAQGKSKAPSRDSGAIRARNDAKSNVSEYKT